jgi:hypothetical protein
MMAGTRHAPRLKQCAQFGCGQLCEDTRFKVREPLRFQPIQRARCITIKVFLKALHLHSQSEGVGRKREQRDEQESVDEFHGDCVRVNAERVWMNWK